MVPTFRADSLGSPRAADIMLRTIDLLCSGAPAIVTATVAAEAVPLQIGQDEIRFAPFQSQWACK